MTELEVHLHDRWVGTLERVEQGRLRFTYDSASLENGGPTRLSLSLPLRRGSFGDPECRPFFAGLLPEGGFLRAVARAFGISASNPFAVLEAIGGECAGAVSLLPPGRRPPSAGVSRWLENEDLAELLIRLPSRPLLAGGDEEGLRLSLAGAQEKLPVLFDGARIGITDGNPPSTHILKLAIGGFDDTVANEAFCLRLARAAGLDAADSRPYVARRDSDAPEGAAAAGGEFLLVARYDRTEPPVRRVHQEDLCQALGSVPELKYEADGGPGVAACADLIGRHSSIPARDRLAFADSLLFNLVIGNRDAHSKNYSLVLEGTEVPRLAPLYDLLSTAVYEGISRKLAMKLGGENRSAYFHPRHLDRLASDLGMRPPALRRRASDLSERIEDAVSHARDQLPAEFADRPVLDRIHDQIHTGLTQLRGALGPA